MDVILFSIFVRDLQTSHFMIREKGLEVTNNVLRKETPNVINHGK